jgi:hypothetical protein
MARQRVSPVLRGGLAKASALPTGNVAFLRATPLPKALPIC